MISPILLYNSEIWGGYDKSDFKAWDGSQIERTHQQFCKRCREVSNKASNVACRAQLGRFPQIISINQRILNYLLYLQSKQPDSFVRQSFLISSDLHTAKVKKFLQSMNQKYISYWQHALQYSQKLEFNRFFENEHATSNYLLSRDNSSRRVSDRKNTN